MFKASQGSSWELRFGSLLGVLQLPQLDGGRTAQNGGLVFPSPAVLCLPATSGALQNTHTHDNGTYSNVQLTLHTPHKFTH